MCGKTWIDSPSSWNATILKKPHFMQSSSKYRWCITYTWTHWAPHSYPLNGSRHSVTPHLSDVGYIHWFQGLAPELRTDRIQRPNSKEPTMSQEMFIDFLSFPKKQRKLHVKWHFVRFLCVTKPLAKRSDQRSAPQKRPYSFPSEITMASFSQDVPLLLKPAPTKKKYTQQRDPK